MKTEYKFINSGELIEQIFIKPIANTCEVIINRNGEDYRMTLTNKPIQVDISSDDHVTVILDTTSAYLNLAGSLSLVEVKGPLEYNENLDRYFMGCTGLISVSDDLLIRNSHIKELNQTFKDCVMFSPKNFNFLECLNDLEVLNETFANTDISFLNKEMFSKFPNNKSKVLNRTFVNCIELSTIAINTFSEINIKAMIETFTGCKYMRSVHPEFLANLSKGIELTRTFSNTGITKVDPNIFTFMPEYATEKDIFENCKLDYVNTYI